MCGLAHFSYPEEDRENAFQRLSTLQGNANKSQDVNCNTVALYDHGFKSYVHVLVIIRDDNF